MEPIRLQKFFTDCGVLSRRAAEEEIRKGAVKVNGEIAEIGCKIDPDTDVVEYRGKVLRPQNAPHHYILLNKPRGFVTTLSDEKGRQTVAQIVAGLDYRVFPVARLDMDSDGALLLTDDGALTQKLTHPRHNIPKHYHVTVAGAVSPAQLERLNAPFMLDGYQTRPAKVELLSQTLHAATLTFELYEGRNRQIRRMCEEVGLSIKQLTRVAIGNITLKGLPVGAYRHLTPAEINYLKENE